MPLEAQAQKEETSLMGNIQLAHLRNFPKKLTFLTSDAHTYVSVSEGKKC